MFDVGQDEIDAISKVILSKKLFRYQGKDVETECSLFEKEFSKYLNVEKTILLSSGTNAIVTALFALGIKAGDEVLIPSYTFFATISAVIEIGATPVLVNVDEKLQIDFNEAELKISAKTKAIIAVHMDGISCDMNRYIEFKLKYNLFLIEDCAQAVGGEFEGKKLGSIGDVGCFSFNVDKIITCGEGGAISFSKVELYQKAMMFHDTCNQFGPTLRDTYAIEPLVGKSMRVSEIQGAMMRVQLKKLDQILEKLKVYNLLLKNELDNKQFKVIKYKEEDCCGTTLKIKFSDPFEMKNNIIRFNSIGLKSMPLLMRPGHNLFYWDKLLNKYITFHKSNFLDSINHLSGTMIVYVSLEDSIEAWKEKIKSII